MNTVRLAHCVAMLGFVVAVACSPRHDYGTFKLVSTNLISDQYETMFDSRVTGRQCYASRWPKEQQVELAVRNAIAQQPGADALVLVDIWFDRDSEQSCVRVEGLPVKMKQ